MSSIAIYARTSTHLQANGLESQLHALKTYCEAKAVTDIRIYTDAGVSGARTSRPGLDQLIADAKAGLVSTVVTYSLSRLSRSTSHLLSTLALFKSLEIGFISLSESIDLKTPMGLMVITVLGAVAQLEREITVERVKTGLANAASKGRYPGRPLKRNRTLIKELHSKGYRQKEIAKLAGISVATVSRELSGYFQKHAGRVYAKKARIA